jgi:hypothetical protein
MQLQDLQPNSTKDAKSSIVVEMKLQIASQEGMVKACKATLHMRLEDHNKLLAKSPSIEEAWNFASNVQSAKGYSFCSSQIHENRQSMTKFQPITIAFCAHGHGCFSLMFIKHFVYFALPILQ